MENNFRNYPVYKIFLIFFAFIIFAAVYNHFFVQFLHKIRYKYVSMSNLKAASSHPCWYY